MVQTIAYAPVAKKQSLNRFTFVILVASSKKYNSNRPEGEVEVRPHIFFKKR